MTPVPQRPPGTDEKRGDRRKNVVVNADDIGLDPAVDEAVTQLAALKRLSSASIMSVGSPAPEVLKELDRLGVSLGLHLDLTSAMFNRRHDCSITLRSLIADAWGRRLDPAIIDERISEQLMCYETMVGRAPVFIDGHQHVHQFPTIRESLVQVLQARYPGQRFYIRNTVPAVWRGWKSKLIGELGGRTLLRLANRAGYQFNDDFCGAYDFSLQAPLHSLWHAWLTSLPMRGGLVMCHPGLPAVSGYDSICEARSREFAFLRSDRFSNLLSDLNVNIVGWDALPRSHAWH